MKIYTKTTKSSIKCLLTITLIVLSSCNYNNEDIKDINGNTYKTIKIGDQEWLAENLRVSNFRNGDSIHEIINRREWIKAGKEGKPAMCYLEDEAENGEKYGMLYNWYAVNDSRGLCPQGWSMPGDKDWRELIDYLGGENTAGEKMKSATGWGDNNGTNESGFSGLPGGYRHYNNRFNFPDAPGGYWWGSTEGFIYIPYSFPLYYSPGGGYRYFTSKGRGFSVRCIKNKQ
jgi:uncharacterized protein (TIGR02145 family)